jgi:hypothetical protein
MYVEVLIRWVFEMEFWKFPFFCVSSGWDLRICLLMVMSVRSVAARSKCHFMGLIFMLTEFTFRFLGSI